MKSLKIMASAATLGVVLGGIAMAQFKPALNESRQIANAAKASQQRIDQLDDETSSLVNDYRAQLKQLESLQRYNASLQRNITAQEAQIERLRQDIDNVSGLQRAVQPLMEDMLAALGEIVDADLPFLLDDRRGRVERLNAAMGNPSVSAAQRYRLIVEAYQIENEYGRTIGAYDGVIDDNGESLSGEFLRIGRVALVFKTPDDSVLKIYDKDERSWVDLNKGTYLADIKLGLRMAKEQTAPSLLPIPVKAPVTGQ
ncbi:MAG: DUF3450 domain-containing protein [Pseudomonadota bacterium]